MVSQNLFGHAEFRIFQGMEFHMDCKRGAPSAAQKLLGQMVDTISRGDIQKDCGLMLWLGVQKSRPRFATDFCSSQSSDQWLVIVDRMKSKHLQ